ncbi:MAG TPA: hypothetical protein ENN47_11870 [Mesotoga infera]|uniref:Uncharacterized protein n=1 Tax=Mesotoga infera TaxID=1236046 RepID=A0A7C1HAU6_9BACT|nr:hypothetical protein [Mesotoga infera]
MRRTILLLIVFVTVITVFASSTLETASASGIETPDPLLLSFREGWKAPQDSSWTAMEVGEISLMLPEGFRTFKEDIYGNFDALLFDETFNLFGRFLHFTSESSNREELLESLISSFYLEPATKGEYSFKEFRQFQNGLTAYLVSLKMTVGVDYPVVLVYSPGEDAREIGPGRVGVFLFEPANYEGEELDRAKSIMAGIVGSYVFQPEIKPEFPLQEKGDHYSFIELASRQLEGEDLGVATENWTFAQGDFFGVMVPRHFTVEFSQDVYEAANIYFYNSLVGKILFGQLHEGEPVLDSLNKVVEDYLMSLGDYGILERFIRQNNESTMYIYSLNFPGLICWAVFYTESTDVGTFGPGKFFVFLSIPDSDEPELWARWYAGILSEIRF